MALVDVRYRFTFVDIGSYGRISDGGVFNSCSLSMAMQSQSLNVPAPSYLVQSATVPVPYVIVADDPFALQTYLYKYLMKPYEAKQLTYEQRIFNYRLSRARRVVENSFGIMSSRFRVFSKAIALSPEKVQVVIMAVCCIHNFLLRNPLAAAQYVPDQDDLTSDLEPIAGPQCGSRPTNEARWVRDQFCSYSCSPAGAVPWQDSAVM